jgi:hypothetical protein
VMEGCTIPQQKPANLSLFAQYRASAPVLAQRKRPCNIPLAE